MNKKAAGILMLIFEILAVILVVGTTFKVSNYYAQSDTVIKEKIVQDLQMMINVFIGIPGNAYVKYPTDVSSYLLVLNNEAIILSEPGNEDDIHKRTLKKFYLPEGHLAEGFLSQKDKVCLRKQNKRITLEEC
jgi:hypothetical protein